MHFSCSISEFTQRVIVDIGQAWTPRIWLMFSWRNVEYSCLAEATGWRSFTESWKLRSACWLIYKFFFYFLGHSYITCPTKGNQMLFILYILNLKQNNLVLNKAMLNTTWSNKFLCPVWEKFWNSRNSFILWDVSPEFLFDGLFSCQPSWKISTSFCQNSSQ